MEKLIFKRVYEFLENIIAFMISNLVFAVIILQFILL